MPATITTIRATLPRVIASTSSVHRGTGSVGHPGAGKPTGAGADLASLRAQLVSSTSRAQWQAPLPASVKLRPASGANCQSYPCACSVSFSTPNVSPFCTSLLGLMAVKT